MKKCILYLAALAVVACSSTQGIAAGRLINISTRVMELAGDPPVIAGTVVNDPAGFSTVMFRGIGEGLGNLPETRGFTLMGAPRLELRDGAGTLVAVSSKLSDLNAADRARILADMDKAGAAQIMAPTDAFMEAILPNGSYTVRMTDMLGGVGIVEAYVVSDTSRFMDVSTRGPTHPEYLGGTMIAGFVTDGPKNVLVRNVGPGLVRFGVPNPIPDPVFTLFASTGRAVYFNRTGFIQTPAGLVTAAEWGRDPASALGTMAASAHAGAFPLTPGSNDAAVVFGQLPPGAWTVLATHASIAPTNGTCLVEVYDVD